MTRHPTQKVDVDDRGDYRFRKNALVRYLLDAGPHDLNTLAALPNIPRADWVQFMQLIGYKVSGFGELSYVKDAEYERAQCEMAKADKRAKKDAR